MSSYEGVYWRCISIYFHRNCEHWSASPCRTSVSVLERVLWTTQQFLNPKIVAHMCVLCPSLRSRPGKSNQRKGQNEKFMNFAHFCEFWCFSLGKQAKFTSNFCSGMPPGKVHELAFLWFGLPGWLLIHVNIEMIESLSVVVVTSFWPRGCIFWTVCAKMPTASHWAGGKGTKSHNLVHKERTLSAEFPGPSLTTQLGGESCPKLLVYVVFFEPDL